MKILFELIKGLFLFMTIAIGIFFVRGKLLFSPEAFILIKQFLVPGYLIFCGLMIGYLITLAYDKSDDTQYLHKIYARYFIVGLSIGILLAIAYIVM
ncbi:MAG: hypothetical protein CR971_00515 [candidate division SR1 bacterium]|nr:MAG: hypothetical protein CR971_00515 [candidate division SR1 bacterium]